MSRDCIGAILIDKNTFMEDNMPLLLKGFRKECDPYEHTFKNKLVETPLLLAPSKRVSALMITRVLKH